MKSELECEKCDLTEFHVHLSTKHPVKATKGKLEYLSSKNSENSEKGVVKKAGCDRCDFSSTDQFSLLFHKINNLGLS